MSAEDDESASLSAAVAEAEEEEEQPVTKKPSRAELMAKHFPRPYPKPAENVQSDKARVVDDDDDHESKAGGGRRRNTDGDFEAEALSDLKVRPAAYGEDGDDKAFHMVNVVVSVALAFPRPSHEDSRVLQELVGKGKKTLDAPKPSYYFHCEYTLVPGTNPTSIDVVTYPVAAKVFTETDTKVVRTWNDGSQVWVIFQEDHEFFATEDLAHLMLGHRIKVQVWNGKEHVSQRAKNDKPKGFRIPGSSDSDSVKDAVSKISSTWLFSQPRNSDSHPSLAQTGTVPPVATNDEDAEVRFESDLKSEPREGYVDAADKKRDLQLQKETERIQNQLKKVHDASVSKAGTQSKTSRSYEEVEELGKIELDIRLEMLFAGDLQITCRVPEPFGPMLDAYATVTLDNCIMPPGIQKKLNPMVMTIKSVKNLPDTPVPYEKLANECEQVYCKFNFMNAEKSVKTPAHPHDKDVYFEDVRVFFLGDYDGAELREYIQAGGMRVEVHDRDQRRRVDERRASLFGTELQDAATAGSGKDKKGKGGKGGGGGEQRSALDDLFMGLPELNYFAYHGVAHIALDDMLRGQTNIYSEAQVLPSKSPEFTGKLMRQMQREKLNVEADKKKAGGGGKKSASSSKSSAEHKSGDSEDYDEQPDCKMLDMKMAALNQRLAAMPLPPGDYITHGTTLKIHLRLCRPLVPRTHAAHMLPLPDQRAPFARVCLRLSYQDKRALRRIDEFVCGENARALGLGHFEHHVMEAALNTYKLTSEQKSSTELDIITGFHVIDGEYHVMVLEGLRDGAIHRLLTTVVDDGSCPVNEEDQEKATRRLYDTSMSFTRRLYAELDVSLSRVRLYQSLKQIVSQPLIYIRDIVPRACLDTVVGLHQITQMTRLRDVVASRLFPTSEMILTLNRELGVPITFKDFENHHDAQQGALLHQHFDEYGNEVDDGCGEKMTGDPKPATKRAVDRKPELDQSNDPYERLLREREARGTADHIADNRAAVRRRSEANGERRRRRHSSAVEYIRANVPPFNYSSQRHNSTQKSKSLLRRFLRNMDAGARFQYGADRYMSSIVEPGDREREGREARMESVRRWRTKRGFLPPGKFETDIDVDAARKDELRLAFRDNVLHANKLSATLQRDTYEWNDPTEMRRYLKPIEYFTAPPKSIFSTGNISAQRLREIERKEKEEWDKKLVVDDPKMHFHRVLPNTEQSHYSHTLDQMGSLLKDPPQKLSLKKFPTPVLPFLSVVHNPSVDTEARNRGEALPPAYEDDHDRNVGFTPGPWTRRSSKVAGNYTPIRDERRERGSVTHPKRMNTPRRRDIRLLVDSASQQ